MKEKIFIDTGFWIALFNEQDDHHQIAKRNFKSIEILKKYDDQYFSYTDCTSFAIMQKEKFTKYAGFDDHFKSMGFYPCM